MIDISALPEPDFIQLVDFEEELQSFIEMILQVAQSENEELYETLSKTIHLESDPVNIIAQAAVYYLIMKIQAFNEGALGTTAAFAKGSNLDVVSANEGLTRRIVQEADNNTSPITPEILESDDSLRRRLYLAQDKKNTAGSEDSYIAYALDADVRVKDVKFISPNPAYVNAYVLSTEGDGAASEELCQIVENYLSAKTVRPIADRLKAYSVEVVHYVLKVKLAANSLPEIEPILLAAKEALNLYASLRRIGEPVHLSAIISAAFVEGVKNIQVVEPVSDLILSPNQIAYCDEIIIEKA